MPREARSGCRRCCCSACWRWRDRWRRPNSKSAARLAAGLDSAVLLATPVTRDIDVPDDVAYGRPMRFRAVPLAPLLAAAGFTAADTVEAVALDGYVAQLPVAALLSDAADGAQAWLAIEPPDAPWPKLPRARARRAVLSGLAGAAGRRHHAEQWPFQLAVLRRVAWPQPNAGRR